MKQMHVTISNSKRDTMGLSNISQGANQRLNVSVQSQSFLDIYQASRESQAKVQSFHSFFEIKMQRADLSLLVYSLNC